MRKTLRSRNDYHAPLLPKLALPRSWSEVVSCIILDCSSVYWCAQVMMSWRGDQCHHLRACWDHSAS
jgi:hypothetical protein